MRTIDTNTVHGLALVQDIDPAGNATNTRYVPLSEAPPMDRTELEKVPTYRYSVYMKQHHYVAAHVLVGLMVHDRIDANGAKPPRDGWTRFHFEVTR